MGYLKSFKEMPDLLFPTVQAPSIEGVIEQTVRTTILKGFV
jgi:hypothetical protein